MPYQWESTQSQEGSGKLRSVECYLLASVNFISFILHTVLSLMHTKNTVIGGESQKCKILYQQANFTNPNAWIVLRFWWINCTRLQLFKLKKFLQWTCSIDHNNYLMLFDRCDASSRQGWEVWPLMTFNYLWHTTISATV